MKSAPIPPDEKNRLSKVMELGMLNTMPEERFDVITLNATKLLKVPISTITIIDENHEWYKSCQGLDSREAPRVSSFCAYAMLTRDVFIVEDTLKDNRFKDNPMVVGKPFIRFYAGVSLYSKDGINMAVFCIKDTKPRVLSVDEIGILLNLASQAEAELNKNNNQ